MKKKINKSKECRIQDDFTRNKPANTPHKWNDAEFEVVDENYQSSFDEHGVAKEPLFTMLSYLRRGNKGVFIRIKYWLIMKLVGKMPVMMNIKVLSKEGCTLEVHGDSQNKGIVYNVYVYGKSDRNAIVID